MHGRRLNEVCFELLLAPVSLLLVKEGEPEAPAPNGSQRQSTMKWVRAGTGAGRRPYIPGSSLRGVLRATASQVVGQFNPAWALADNPFANAAGDGPPEQPSAASDEANEQPGAAGGGPEVYGRAGPLERCFGSTALRGRWLVRDALWNGGAGSLPKRDGVGINRDTGAAQHSIKFDFEYIASGRFKTTLTLVNYELWQLGLVAHVLARLDAGEARLGSRTRSGLGRVRLAVTGIRFDWYGPGPTPSAAGVKIPSLATLAADAKLPNGYGFADKDITPPVIPLEEVESEFGAAWRIAPATVSLPDLPGFAATDWNAPPWPTLGPLLPDVVARWPAPAEQAAVTG